MSDYQDRFATLVGKDKRPANCYLLACIEKVCFCDTVDTENLKHLWGKVKQPALAHLDSSHACLK